MPHEFLVLDFELTGAHADTVFEHAAKLAMLGDIQPGGDNHHHFAALGLHRVEGPVRKPNGAVAERILALLANRQASRCALHAGFSYGLLFRQGVPPYFPQLAADNFAAAESGAFQR